ncbi:MAG: bifunctional 5,10-methylenetetrahydrofolate dehydrogenase/5,10-methenyltetrahydrofolate cyclohydrolase [Clostridiales bacterium]|nr:bifunctional 5,10-methylenetetrahydrofolate dehydrogenase/5,10-methenyltetrahydrofolate cyclohydrolase [Clostridiales bacterium]
METVLLKGKPVADNICASIVGEIERLKADSVEPCLAIVRVGQKPDDIYYESGATKRMQSVGIKVKSVVLDAEVSQSELEDAVSALSNDASVHGILLLMPLPRHIDEKRIKSLICPEKDIDGLTDGSMVGLYAGTGEGFAPCTPSAVMELLDFNCIDVCGKNVVIVGRSLVVGKPQAMLMLEKNATVTVCHSKTKDLKSVCRGADILVAAVGRARMINKDHVKNGAVVVDVGINQDENGAMCGDVDTESVMGIASKVTPVPGGVGSITTSVLAKHVVEAAKRITR